MEVKYARIRYLFQKTIFFNIFEMIFIKINNDDEIVKEVANINIGS